MLLPCLLELHVSALNLFYINQTPRLVYLFEMWCIKDCLEVVAPSFIFKPITLLILHVYMKAKLKQVPEYQVEATLTCFHLTDFLIVHSTATCQHYLTNHSFVRLKIQEVNTLAELQEIRIQDFPGCKFIYVGSKLHHLQTADYLLNVCTNAVFDFLY